MKNNLALRYLLLRHIKLSENRMDKEVFLEIARTLHVAMNHNSYVVTWKEKGREREKIFKQGEFVFYEKGDVGFSPEAGKDVSVDNDIIASRFVAEALSIDGSTVFGQKKRWSASLKHDIIETTVFAAIMIVFGKTGFWGSFGWPAVLFVEYFRKGRLIASALLLLLSFAPKQGGIFLGAASYAILQFLDSDPTDRKLRVFLCFLASITAFLLSFLGWSDPYHFGAFFWCSFILAIFISASRSLISSHFRAMPMVLPFICAGLALNDEKTAAIIGLCFCLSSAVIVRSRWCRQQ